MFRIDPVVVLDANDIDWIIRVAAHNIVADDLKREAEQARRR